jgi:hypothetical protein
MPLGIEMDDRVRRFEAGLVGAQHRVDRDAHVRHVAHGGAQPLGACRADVQHERRHAVIGEVRPHLREQQRDGVAVAQIRFHDARDQTPQPVVEVRGEPRFEVRFLDEPLDGLADQIVARARQFGGGVRASLSAGVLAQPVRVALGFVERVARARPTLAAAST